MYYCESCFDKLLQYGSDDSCNSTDDELTAAQIGIVPDSEVIVSVGVADQVTGIAVHPRPASVNKGCEMKDEEMKDVEKKEEGKKFKRLCRIKVRVRPGPVVCVTFS